MILYIKIITLENGASSEMTNFQRDLVFKRAFLKRTTQILFPIVVNSVYDHLLPYLTVKTVKFLVHIFYEHPQKTISLPDV